MFIRSAVRNSAASSSARSPVSIDSQTNRKACKPTTLITRQCHKSALFIRLLPVGECYRAFLPTIAETQLEEREESLVFDPPKLRPLRLDVGGIPSHTRNPEVFAGQDTRQRKSGLVWIRHTAELELGYFLVQEKRGIAWAKSTNFELTQGLRADNPWNRFADPGQRMDNYDQLDERTDWFYEAISSSYTMITKTAGRGLDLPFHLYRQGRGMARRPLLPAPRFAQPPDEAVFGRWRSTTWTHGISSAMNRLKAEITSNTKGLKSNADGSVDVYFGPKPPDGDTSNSVQTVPDRFWFPYFRLFAPTEAYFDRSWPLPDIERVK